MAGRRPILDTHVVVAGDWHANIDWIGRAIPSIARTTAGVRTVLHVGDFGLWKDASGRKFLDAVDFWCGKAGISRILVTPGNHEDWEWLDSEFALHPNQAVALSSVVEILPRGYRFEIGDRTFVSFSGAASVDFQLRSPGIDWFPSEMPTENDVVSVASAGHADVLLTHEAIDGGTRASELVLSGNPMQWSEEALDYSTRSRGLVTQAWEAVTPELLFHGHMHVADARTLTSGQQIISLGRDGQSRNLALLEISTLTWHWLEGTPKR